jgi:site-specific recombinase XerD
MEIKPLIREYLDYCEFQQNLAANSLKAYRIDLEQSSAFWESAAAIFNRANISQYIVSL